MIRRDFKGDLGQLASWGSQWYADRKQELQTKHSIWAECQKAYDCKFGESWAEVAPYRSQRYMSLPWATVESESSSYVNGVMPNDDWFQAVGRTPDDTGRSKAIQSLVMFQQDKTYFREDVHAILKSAAIYGNVPYAVEWQDDIVQLPSIGLDGKLSYSDLKAYSGPKLKMGNIFDYVQDLKPSSNKYAMRGMRTFVSKGYLEERNKASEGNKYTLYENLEEVQEVYTERDTSDSLVRELQQEKGINPKIKDMVELIQIEGDIEIPGGMDGAGYYKNHLLLIANRTTVLRFEPNPAAYGVPTWNLFTLFKDPSCTFGYGVLEPVLGLNDGIQCRSNQVYEANALAINPVFKVDPTDPFYDRDALVSAPGAQIPCRDPEKQLIPLNVPSAAALGMNEVGFLISQFNQTTGASMNFGGGVTGDSVSATQASIQAKMGSERRKATLAHINTWLMDVLKRWSCLDQQLMDEDAWIRISADQMGRLIDPETGQPLPMQPLQLKVRPEDIVGDFDFVPQGSNRVEEDRQKVQDLFQMATQMLNSPMAPAFKLPELAQELFRMGGYTGSWKFLKSQQEMEFDERKRLANEAMLQQGGGPKPGGPGANPTDANAPGVRGLASLPGVPEGPGEIPGGPDESQLAGNRLG